MENKFLQVSYLTGKRDENNRPITQIGYIIKEFIQGGDTYYIIVETLYNPCDTEIILPHRVVKFHSNWHL
jgi:hypothetical protein